MSSPRRLAVALSALAATVFAVAATSASAAIPREFWGVSPQTPLEDTDYPRMGQGNVGTIRIGVFWGLIDPSPAAGDIDWSTIDPVIQRGAQNGIEVLPYLFGTPEWVAEGIDGRRCQPAKCALYPPKSRKALAAWETFVGEFLDRYGQNGTFWTEHAGTVPKVPIDAIQTWNEQNSSKFFLPKAKPGQYAKLLGATADGVSDHDPSVEIVLGGMAQLAGSKEAETGTDYLADLYDIKGVKDNFEGVAVHPYGASLSKVAGQVEEFRKVIKKARDSGASLWVTEVGAGSASGGNPLNRGLQGQANLLTDMFKYFRKKRNKFNIETVIWFSWMDNKVSFCDWCKSAGLFKIGLKEKPSWRAFTKFTGGS